MKKTTRTLRTSIGTISAAGPALSDDKLRLVTGGIATTYPSSWTEPGKIDTATDP